MKEKSHRAKRRCYRSGVWTLRGTHTRRLDGHSLYSAQRAQGPRDFQADHRAVRSAPRQLRWRRDSDQGGRRPTRADVALGQRHSRSPAGYPGRSPKDNPRFLVTNLPHRPATVYTRLYCGRGDMENRLKELQQGLAMDRTSCSRFAANQLRLLFSLAAYVLFQVLQGFARGAAVGPAQVWTLRERLLKVAVWTERSVRRIVLHFPQAFPWRDAWQQLAQALRAT